MAQPIMSLLYIQCDWNSILSEVGAEAWISCKHKDNPGIHGKIRTVTSLPSKPSLSISEGFKIEDLTRSSIIIKHEDSYSTIFLAPHRIYSGVHTGSIESLDVTNEGLAVSSSSKGQLLVWDTRTGETKISLTGHVFEVYKCRFFPSGKVVLSCGADMSLKIWCAKTGICPVTLSGHKMAVTDVDFVNRGKNIVSSSKDGSIKLWHCGKASCVDSIVSVTSNVNCCKIFEAPAYLNLGERKFKIDDAEVDTGNKILLFGCEDGTVHCYGLESRECLFKKSLESAINCIAFVGKDHFVVGCQNGQVTLFSLKDRDSFKTWHESNSAVLNIKDYQKSGFFISRADGTVFFIPENGYNKRISLTGPNCDPVYDVATDGKNIYTCCRDGVVRLYHVENSVNYVTNKS